MGLKLQNVDLSAFSFDSLQDLRGMSWIGHSPFRIPPTDEDLPDLIEDYRIIYCRRD